MIYDVYVSVREKDGRKGVFCGNNGCETMGKEMCYAV